MTPDPVAYCAPPRTHVDLVVVGRRGSATAPFAALPALAPDLARHGEK